MVPSAKRCAFAICVTTMGMGSIGHAADLPDYMAAISGNVTTSPAEVANNDVLALNTAMFGLYETAGRVPA